MKSLDDRSIIRHLQRELALARQQGGGGMLAGEQNQEQYLEWSKGYIASAAAHDADAPQPTQGYHNLRLGSRLLSPAAEDTPGRPSTKATTEGALGSVLQHR
jgi:hypothetical protein